MPAPDIQYFLDASLECTHIAPDVHAYMMHLCPEVDSVVDRYDGGRGRGASFARHWFRLQDMGRYCEEHFLDWRRDNRELSRGTSYVAFDQIPFQIRHTVENHAALLVDTGFERLSALALLRSEQHFGLSNDIAVMRRACRRAYHDLEGYRPEAVAHAKGRHDEIYEPLRALTAEALAEYQKRLAAREAPAALTAARVYQQAQSRRLRNAVKRSKEFTRRLLGKQTTRLLLRGNGIQIQGELGCYEIKLENPAMLTTAHGGARLTVLTREGDIELCRLCIYTPGVPILDHVSSIVMHIRAGEEEQILKVGNPFSVKDAAYEQDWLRPYLPQRTNRRGLLTLDPRRLFGLRHVTLPREERRQRILAMSSALHDHIHATIGPFVPPMETTSHHIRTGEVLPGSVEEERGFDFDVEVEDPDDPIEGALCRARLHGALRQITTSVEEMIQVADGIDPAPGPTDRLLERLREPG